LDEEPHLLPEKDKVDKTESSITSTSESASEADKRVVLETKSSESEANFIGPMEAGLDGELILGLVGAVGTEFDTVVSVLSKRLQVYLYSPTEVRISKMIIPEIVKSTSTASTEYDRIDQAMNDGDAARCQSGNNGILALGAASWIASRRKKTMPSQRRRAYIINSLKHPEEVLSLRKIYPLGFYLIGVYSDEDRRYRFLRDDLHMNRRQIVKLMRRDKEEAEEFGQKVTETFHLSDYFVRLSSDSDEFKNGLWRFLEILFGYPYNTPTFDEYAMFLAFASSLRSGDLSRQVGAVISKDHEILSTGANDCPKAGGGLYWPEFNQSTKKIEDVKGGRDYTIRQDSNRVEQKKIIDQIVKQASNSGVDRKIIREVLENSRIQDLTEFGRMVHAEMEALLACARNGVSCRNASLFSTTFPCHNCAKHIIAAGIRRVVYIQPYQKSKAEEFHRDALPSVPIMSETKSWC